MINTRNARIALLALALPTLAPSGSHAQDPDWPQWLGPQRNGISTETALFGASPTLEEVWRVEGGAGFSALSVTDGKLMIDRPVTPGSVIVADGKAVAWAARPGELMPLTPLGPWLGQPGTRSLKIVQK